MISAKHLAVAFVASAVVFTRAGLVAQNSGERLEITAFAVSMGTIATGANAVVAITVTRWTTPADRKRLATTLIEKGDKALLSELQRMPSHGRFRIPGLTGPDPHQLRLGHDLRYA